MPETFIQTPHLMWANHTISEHFKNKKCFATLLIVVEVLYKQIIAQNCGLLLKIENGQSNWKLCNAFLGFLKNFITVDSSVPSTVV